MSSSRRREERCENPPLKSAKSDYSNSSEKEKKMVQFLSARLTLQGIRGKKKRRKSLKSAVVEKKGVIP